MINRYGEYGEYRNLYAINSSKLKRGLNSACIISGEFPPTLIFALLYLGTVKSHPDLQQHLTYMQHRANVSLCLKVPAGDCFMACVRSLCISSVCSG